MVSLPRVTPDGGHGSVILAEMGTNVLEFATVSRITGDSKYRLAAEKGLRAVHAANANVRAGGWVLWVGGAGQTVTSGGRLGEAVAVGPAKPPMACMCRLDRRDRLPRLPSCPMQALMLESVDRQTGKETGYKRGVGAGTDSYYEYLIKCGWLGQGGWGWAAWRMCRRWRCLLAAGSSIWGTAALSFPLSCQLLGWTHPARLPSTHPPTHAACHPSSAGTGCWAAARTSTSGRAGSSRWMRCWSS